jgi:hypothetical protein
MNQSILLIIFSFGISFSQQNFNLTDNRLNTEIGYVQIEDSTCLTAIEKAKLDFEKGIIIYSITDFNYEDCKAINEFKKLLNGQNIQTSLRLTQSAKIKGRTYYCYEKYMNGKINEKFGNDFIEKNLKKADSLFLINKQKKKIRKRSIAK